MAAFQIPEHIDNQLDKLAETTGQSKENLILEALNYSFGFEQEEDRSLSLSEFTPAELERMDRSAEQVRRGELVSGEEVSAKLKRWQTEFAAR